MFVNKRVHALVPCRSEPFATLCFPAASKAHAFFWGDTTMTMTKVAMAGFAFLWAGVVVADNDCAFMAERTAEFSVDGIERLQIRAGAGELKVEGESGRRNVQASGHACARSEAQLERVQIRLEREGNTLVLEALPLDDESFHPRNWFGATPTLDLTVQIPAGLAVDVHDGSGGTHIANVGDALVEDGSGDLVIENVQGGLKVIDGSGEATIREVQGAVRIEDGSGDFSIKNIVGDVIVVSDGSGEIEIVDVRGSVTVGNDGSGEIRIETVSGSVRIEDDSSGGIAIRDVQHDVIIDNDGSGSIVVADVQGDFFVEDGGSGAVEYENVRGRVSIAGEDTDDRGEQGSAGEPTEADEAAEESELER